MQHRLGSYIFALAFVCAPWMARADNHYLLPHWGDPGRIATDRPGFSFTTETVAPGHFLLESAFDYTYNRDSGVRVDDLTIMPMLGRLGVTDWLELRAQWTGLHWVDVDAGQAGETQDTAVDDSIFGFKVRLLRNDKGTYIPNISLIASAVVPTGDDALAADAAYPDLRLPWNIPIDEHLTVYGSLVARVPDYGTRFYEGGLTAAVGYFFDPRIGLYAEYYGLYPAKDERPELNLFSVGPIWKPFDDFQVDVRLSTAVGARSPDFQTSLGLSFLL